MREYKIEQLNRHATALAKLADIFKDKTEQIQKVDSTLIQSLVPMKAPADIHNDPRVHQRKSQANNPGKLPPKSRVIMTQVSSDEAKFRAP